MAIDPRKRQKKLQRRKAKKKAKNQALARRDVHDLAARIERAAAAPILHCCTTDVLWDQGMSNVLVSRELKSGNVAFVAFLLDVYCLGVKDVAFDIAPRSRYDWKIYGKMFGDYQVVDLEPEAACKLIEGAVEYARDLGLLPHPDYRKAKRIFGDVDADSCTEEFEYGKDGKPYFVAGPHDDRERCSQIISILTNRCGPNGFHYLMPREAMETLPAGGRILDVDHLDDPDEIEEGSF